jgi:leader peptidase (prepilin peptidase)/N-methyltransferase
VEVTTVLSDLITLAVGAVVGSFLNVMIVRLPKRQSLITPRSRCPACGSPIRWFDNIPIVSFLWLRARCRHCSSRIAWRYLAIEVLTAALFWYSSWRIGWRIELLSAWLLLAALIAISAIDLEHQIIPDAITLPGIVVGFLFSFITASPPWLDSLLGVLVGGGIPFVVIVVSRGGMGGGDMKLGAMLGAFLGYKLALAAIFSGVVLGGLVAGILLAKGLRGRKDPIPFGPFLAGGGVVALLFGEGLIRWYFAAFTG